MKKNITVLLIVLINFSSFSQEDSVYWATPRIDTNEKESKIKFGFGFGLNKTIVESKGLPETAVEFNKIGVRVGIFAEYNYNEFLSLLPKAELSVNNYKIDFNDTSTQIHDFFPFPLCIDFSFHAKFKYPNGKLKPFLSIGPSIELPLKVQRIDNTSSARTPPNFSLDVSIGLEKAFKKFTISPELRYSHGLVNINTDQTLELIKLHSLSLIFNIF
jgi:hypothetical protein